MKKVRLHYIDSSFYLGVILKEEAALSFGKKLGNKPAYCSSVLLFAESERNLVRLARLGHLKPTDYEAARTRLKQDADFIVLRDVTLDLCLGNPYPPVKIPKSSDLVHLQTAAWFYKRELLASFVTMDREQKSAARELGLPVYGDQFASDQK